MKKILFIIGVLGILFLAGCQVGSKECEKCFECEEYPKVEEKAMLKAEVILWAINLYDETEMFFEFWVYNFGDTEAKDVDITCKLFDGEYNFLDSVTDNFGNIASYSIEGGEVLTKNVMKEGIGYIGLCYIESCNDCEILYKNIPELVETYENI